MNIPPQTSTLGSWTSGGLDIYGRTRTKSGGGHIEADWNAFISFVYLIYYRYMHAMDSMSVQNHHCAFQDLIPMCVDPQALGQWQLCIIHLFSKTTTARVAYYFEYLWVSSEGNRKSHLFLSTTGVKPRFLHIVLIPCFQQLYGSETGSKRYTYRSPTLPKTNIALENEWLEDEISFREFLFYWGELLVLGRLIHKSVSHTTQPPPKKNP